MSKTGHDKANQIASDMRIECTISCHLPEVLQGFRQMMPI